MNIRNSEYNGLGEITPKISWSAIWAGAFVAFISQVTLLSLGSAIGFSSLDPQAIGTDAGAGGSMTSVIIYTLVTALLSLFAAGYVAARLANYRGRTISALHGLCAWAVVSTLTVVLVGIGVGKVVGSAVGLVGEGLKSAAVGGVKAASGVDLENINADSIGAEIRSILRDTGKADLAPNKLANQAKALPKKAIKAQADEDGKSAADVVSDEGSQLSKSVDKDAVANVLSKRLGISKADATSLLDQGGEKASEALEQIKSRAKAAGIQAAEASKKAAVTTSWATFSTLILGAIAAFMGGLLGGPLGMGSLKEEDI